MIPRPDGLEVYVIKATISQTEVKSVGYAARALNLILISKLKQSKKNKDITSKEYRRARKLTG